MSMATTDTAVTSVHATREDERPRSLWSHAFATLRKDKLAMMSLSIVVFYSLVAFLSATGLLAGDWALEVGGSYDAPGEGTFLGTDILGRSVFWKVIKGTEVAMSVGLVTCIISTAIGLFFGVTAGYFGGKIDELIVWLYTSFSSIPYIMLLASISFIMGKGITAVYFALGLSSWVGLCRLIRGEVIKHKEREYVQAASSIGVGHSRKMLLHILPNVTHIVIINASLLFQTAIKSEVILSYLGLGVQDRPSWGKMINAARLELAREPSIWWQLAGATVAMFLVVLAFNILGDALRDALDPKLKGK